MLVEDYNKLFFDKTSYPSVFFQSFLGTSPNWYKILILLFLTINPFAYSLESYLIGGEHHFITGWLFIFEAICVLSMSLKCCPLPPFSLLTIEAVVLKLTTPELIYSEVNANFSVILLLVFVIASIHFHKNILRFLFTKVIIRVHSKVKLSLMFLLISAVLSAFLNALTITVIIITICVGIYTLFTHFYDEHPALQNSVYRLNKRHFQKFLRSILMHSLVGTAVGGVFTIVGEPQNFLIGKALNWDFKEFAFHMFPASLSVLIFSIIVCVLLEKYKLFGYGEEMPEEILELIKQDELKRTKKRDTKERTALVIEALNMLFFVVMLASGVAEAGLIGLASIGLITAFAGINKDEDIGQSFKDPLPFTALIILFFAIASVIHHEALFEPITHWILSFKDSSMLLATYTANALLSMISDNVFVATVYMSEIQSAFAAGDISKEQLDALGIAITVGTNISSIATPNGQAAFLFLLTSTITPLIHLTYGRMILMALPYTIVLSIIGILATCF